MVSDKTGLVSARIHHGRYDGEKSSASLTTFPDTKEQFTDINVEQLGPYPQAM